MEYSIHFQPLGIDVPIEAGKPLIEAARRLSEHGRLSIQFPCGGHGHCAQCRVKLLKGYMRGLTASEEDLLTPEDVRRGYRLACQAVPEGSLEISIPPESLAGNQDFEVDGEEQSVALEPAIRRIRLQVRESSLNHPRSLWDQIETVLQRDPTLTRPSVDLNLIQRKPALATEGEVNVTLQGNRITNAFASAQTPRLLGLAVDLGTTKVAGYLVDLEDGRVVASEGMVNPQACYGDDIMTRLAYALTGSEHYGRIRDLQRQGLNLIVESLARKADVSPEDIEYGVIAGNSAMQHLVLGLPVEQLARAPYVPATTGPVRVRAKELDLQVSPGSEIYFMPSIGGFVGGDHVAMILAGRIHETKGVTLGLDVGTNSEVVLVAGRRILSCSCPSGPVFEGAHISDGMKAIAGAISAVRLQGTGITLETIGGERALGVCGSGVVDATWEMVRTGIVNEHGVMDRSHPRVRENEHTGAHEFMLAEPHETGLDRSIVLTQADVGEIQLAKAAIASGIRMLFARAGISETDIDLVVVAGAFGNRLNLQSAVGIGMLPDIPVSRFRAIGNAAGTGARMVLVSETERKTAERIAQEVEYVELTAEPDFGATFSKALRFSPHGTIGS